MPVISVKESDGMEGVGPELSIMQEDEAASVPLSLTPFQILALRLSSSESKTEN